MLVVIAERTRRYIVGVIQHVLWAGPVVPRDEECTDVDEVVRVRRSEVRVQLGYLRVGLRAVAFRTCREKTGFARAR